MNSTGNQPLDALLDAIAPRLGDHIIAALEGSKSRLLNVEAAAKYIGRSRFALRHLIAKKKIPSVRQDGRVFLDRKDLDNWLEMGKTRV